MVSTIDLRLSRFAALLLLVGVSCGSRERVVRVELEEVPTTASNLRLDSLATGYPPHSETISASLREWILPLPEGGGEQLDVHLTGLDASGCLVATGLSSTLLGEGDEQITLRARTLAGAVCDVGLASTLCSKGGWCWANPLPHGNLLTAVWGASESDVWIAGLNGLLTHWNGIRWEHYGISGDVGSASTITALWGASANDVWAVGERGLIAHWDGNAWTPALVPWERSPQNLSAIWGSRSDDVWAVGSFGTLLHWDGRTWEPVRQEQLFTERWLFGIWGRMRNGRSELYVVGESGAIFSIEGDTSGWRERKSWIIHNNSSWSTLHQIREAADGALWAIGENGTLLMHGPEQQPRQWTQQFQVSQTLLLHSLSDRWLVGSGGTVFRLTAGTWVAFAQPGQVPDLHSVWEFPGGTAFAVGAQGAFLFFDGRQWQQLRLGDTNDIQELWADSALSVSRTGNALLRPGEAGWFREISTDLDGIGLVTDVIRIDAAQSFAITDGGWVLSTRNGHWERAVAVPGQWTSIATTDGQDIWLGTTGSLLQLSGMKPVAWIDIISESGSESHSHIPLRDKRVSAIWNGDEVWAVGDGQSSPGPEQRSLVCKVVSDFCRMEQSITITKDLHAIWGVGSNLWAVGDDGVILMRRGGGWELQQSPTLRHLRAIWGSRVDDVWVAGDAGTILHFDGVKWVLEDTGTRNHLRSVWGDGRGGVWAAGEGGTILTLRRAGGEPRDQSAQ